MSIITISRGSYNRGKEVAERVAKELGYECIAREAIVEASQEFNIPEVKLVRALHDAPSILDKFSYGKEKFVAYYQLCFLEHLQRDNIVYHGLAGHFLLKGISHVLKVRIMSDMLDRVKLEMEREKISEKEALRILQNDDEERRRWSRHLYGIDTDDPSLYDLLIHIKKITVDDAVDIICHTVRFDHFKTSAGSRAVLDDMLLAARVKVALLDRAPSVEVTAIGGNIFIKVSSSEYRDETLSEKIAETAQSVPGVKGIEINEVSMVPFGD
ncbi:MAG: AAA family ATPase [Dissulfurispiraceae bacterium]